MDAKTIDTIIKPLNVFLDSIEPNQSTKFIYTNVAWFCANLMVIEPNIKLIKLYNLNIKKRNKTTF